MEKEVSFYSAGLKLAATLYVPDGLHAAEKLPGIVLCHGLRGKRQIILPGFARAFGEQGFVALAFDFRGFGDSEGPQGRLISRERVDDIVNATTFLGLQPEIDASRIALFGISSGAANAISAAAIDPRVRAVVAEGAFGDGKRWLRVNRTLYDFHEFRKRIEEDRVHRVLTGKSEMVPDTEMIPPTPAEQAYFTTGETSALRVKFPLETADDLLSYKPEAVIHEISPRPVFLIGAELDYIIDGEESVRLHEKAREPKRLHILPGMSHTEPYSGKGLDAVVKLSADFFREFMG